MARFIQYIRQFGRFKRNARLYLYSMALSYVTIGMITVLYNLYLTALGYGTDFIGLILFIGTIGGALAIFPAGLCIDAFGGKAILIWASVLIGIAGAGQMLFRSAIPLLVSAFVAGIGGAFILVVNVPFLSLNSTEEERPHLFSLNIVIALVATVIGETVGGLLPIWLRTQSWLMSASSPWLHILLVDQPQARAYQLALLISGVIAAPSFIPLFLLSEDSSSERRQSLQRPALSRSWWRASETRIRGFLTLQQVNSIRGQMNSPLVVLTAIYGLIGLGAGLFLPYMNVYFVQQLGASSALFGVIDASANTLNALLTLLSPWVVTRIGMMATLLVPRLLGIPLMVLIGCVPLLGLAAALYPLRQGLTDMSQGILQVFSMERVHIKHRGIANSSYQAAYQAFWAIGASLGGLTIKYVGYPAVFISAAILYSLAYGLLWWRFRTTGAAGVPLAEKKDQDS